MGVQRRSGLLTSPVFALSVLVLLANDHVFKRLWPGLITGKLSDIAGVVIIAILVASLVGHAELALVATAVSFSLLKTAPVVAKWAAPALGGVTRSDWRDLVALLALLPLWWWMRSRRTGVARDYRQLRMLLRIALLTGAVVATTATSREVGGVDRIVAYKGVLLAEASDGKYISTDGGKTWQSWPKSQRIDRSSLKERTRVCVDSDCFHADESARRLTQTNAGSRATPVLEMNADQSNELRQAGTSPAFATIAAIEAGNVTHVVVSMGPAGALYRSPDGTWEWVRIGRWRVHPGTDRKYLGLPVANQR